MFFITFTPPKNNHMLDRIDKLLHEAQSFSADTLQDIEEFRIGYLGKKGHLTLLFSEFKSVPPELKREVGQRINDLKNFVSEKVTALKKEMDEGSSGNAIPDLTVPGHHFPVGSRHPISIVRNQIIDIFTRLGYNISEGPEIEDDWHVFSALNFPPEHPAR
ncbi:MAG: phenylalanine--tRNA ligase subunit alpha, partial [Bacteroidales bacterium]|nr:phenylalanine--tRNA ligase subunit alpha [Bacteroidales bacterium]